MKHAEAVFQRQVAGYLVRILPPSAWFSAIGHGGGGHVRGAVLKGMGVKPGLPDLIVLWGGRCIGLELKSAKGVQSLEQKGCQAAWIAAGAGYAVVRTLAEVEVALLAWQVPLCGRLA